MLPITRRLLTKKMLILPCALMMSCSEPKAPPDPTMIEKIELRNGALSAVFAMPASYKARRATDNLLKFTIKYPSMEAANPDAIPEPDTISFYIQVFDGLGSTEYMVSKSSDHFDPAYPGQYYHAGTENFYELYRHIRGRGASQTEITTRVFKAEDGSLVGIEDPGEWSVCYEVERKIKPNLHIKYLIAKPLGNDFIQIDKAVTIFIKQHLQTNSR
jgi:hypothetical protein